MSRRQKRLRAKQLRHAGRRPSRTASKVAMGVALTAGAAMAAAPAASAGTFVVQNTNDDGAGSLRERIQEANDQVGADSIFFTSGLTGDIELASDLPPVENDPLTISGPSMDDITVDGGGEFEIFRSEGQELSVGGLTVANGRRIDGGAIYVNGATLSVSNARFVGNASAAGSNVGDSGGAIAIQNGEAQIGYSEFTGNRAFNQGGAIFASDTVISVYDSTFDANTSRFDGGAIYSSNSNLSVSASTFTSNGTEVTAGGAITAVAEGELDVRDSSFSDNEADTGGGAIVAAAEGQQTVAGSTFDGNASFEWGGSAIFANAPGGLTVTNSTFARNVASGGGGGTIRAAAGETTVLSSTISGNSVSGFTPTPEESGSGIVVETGVAEVRNSIVAGNTPADLSSLPEDEPRPAGSFETSFDVIGNDAGATVTETVPGSNVVAGDGFRMGPLADNGGDVETMLPGTAAVNQGSTPLTVDSRFLTRPIQFPGIPNPAAAGANGADIGAVELQANETPVPPVGPTGPTGPTQPTGPTGPTGPTIEPSNKFSFAGVKLNKKKGVATLKVKVPGAGRLVLPGSKTVKKSKKSARAKATLKLTVKAKGKALKKLKKKGKATVKAKVKFTPSGGKPRTKSKTVKLVKKRRS